MSAINWRRIGLLNWFFFCWLLVASFYASAEDLHLGLIEYEIACLPCHGMDAHGDGPLAATLDALPSDLTQISLLNGGSFPETRVNELIDGRKQVAAHGPRQMPVWGKRYRLKHVLDEDPNVIERRARGRIEALVKYLISIQKK